MKNDQDYLVKKVKEWQKNPVLFVEEAVGVTELDPKQEEVLMGLASIVRAKEKSSENKRLTNAEKDLSGKIGCSVQSGKGVGKTALAALAVIWFMTCFPYPKLPLLGPKAEQLKKNLWSEIAKWIRHSVNIFGEDCIVNHIFEMESEKMYMKHVMKTSLGKEWLAYILTFPKNMAKEEQQAAIQGIHGEYVLFVIDEGSGVPDYIFEPIEGTLTGKVNIVLNIFNPNKNTGWAIETQRKMKSKWLAFQINAEKSSLVSQEHIEYMRQKYGIDSNKYRIGVLGQPPLSEEDALIPWEWIQRARDRYEDFIEDPLDPEVYGVDIGGGGDPSVIGYRKGMKIMEFRKRNEEDTAKIRNWVARNFEEDEPDFAFIDANGIGHHVYFDLKDIGYNFLPYKGRNQADNRDRFEMIRDEDFWRLRGFFERDEIVIPPDDDELEGELSILKFDDDNAGGKIKIISKKKLKAEGYASTNKADCLAMMFRYPEKVMRRKVQAKKQITKRRRTRQLVGVGEKSWMGA